MAIPIAISGAAFCSNCNHLPIEEVSEKGPHSRLNWRWRWIRWRACGCSLESKWFPLKAWTSGAYRGSRRR